MAKRILAGRKKAFLLMERRKLLLANYRLKAKAQV
jgi:hypothetical protein